MSNNALYNPMAGMFPVISYIHVPKQMPAPTWMMMGTCFVIKPPTQLIRNRAPVILLSCAHTFIPWKYVDDPKELKIPDQFRKARFITSRLFMYDENGKADAGRSVPMTVASVHPVKDIALLTISPQNCDSFFSMTKERRLFKEFELMPSVPPGDSVVVSGFRAEGKLGTFDSLSHEAIQKLPPDERTELLNMMRSVEGKQHSLTLSAITDQNTPNRAKVTHGAGYNGLSGGPVLPTREAIEEGKCCGIVTKKVKDNSNLIEFETSSDVLKWCNILFARVEEPDLLKKFEKEGTKG